MLLVGDTNVFFTYFWENSSTKELLTIHKLIVPKLSLIEINKYESSILSKTGISGSMFSELKQELAKLVDFIPKKEYINSLKEMESYIKSLDLSEHDEQEMFDDIDFLSLALKLNCPLWSNDKLLKKQSKVDVLNTREVIELTVFTSVLFSR